MSNGEVRKVSLQDIQLNLIERCLQLYMSQKEVVNTLLHQAKIEPGFTELVWQKLEAENQEFFRAYHVRLIVKEQISIFNRLLERQVELMGDMSKAYVVPAPPANGSQGHPRSSINEENLHPKIAATPNLCTVGTSPLQPHVQVGFSLAADHSGRFGYAENPVVSHGLSAGMMQAMNRAIIKPEDVYRARNSTLEFGGDNSLEEHQSTIGEVSISPFNGTESNHQAVNETFLDMETNSLGFLGQIPRNFSLSDLTADFSNSADILENYSRSPYLGPDTIFFDSHLRGEQDLKKLDTIVEGFGFEDFGND